MKITDIELGMLRVPLKTPFKTALRTVDTVEDVVVLIRTDSGHTGYGEAPATAVITGDTHGSIIEAIDGFIKPRLIGDDVATPVEHGATAVVPRLDSRIDCGVVVPVCVKLLESVIIEQLAHHAVLKPHRTAAQ